MQPITVSHVRTIGTFRGVWPPYYEQCIMNPANLSMHERQGGHFMSSIGVSKDAVKFWQLLMPHGLPDKVLMLHPWYLTVRLHLHPSHTATRELREWRGEGTHTPAETPNEANPGLLHRVEL